MVFKPLISVVIPTYNRPQQTIAALDSVIAQTYANIEIIIVDDGTEDQTALTLQRLIEDRSGAGVKISYFRQVNQGASVARNRGIAEARGTWIAFLDSDDVWLPEKLELQVCAVERFGDSAGVCVTDASLINESGAYTTAFRESSALRNVGQACTGLVPDAVLNLARSFDHMWISTLLVRADLIRQTDGFDPNINAVEDHDFNFRVSLLTQFCYVNKVLVLLDRSATPPGSTCRPWDKYDVHLLAQRTMFVKWLKMATLPRNVQKTIRQNLRRVYSAMANSHLENNRRLEAAQAMFSAAKHDLTVTVVLKGALVGLAPTVARRIWRNPVKV